MKFLVNSDLVIKAANFHFEIQEITFSHDLYLLLSICIIPKAKNCTYDMFILISFNGCLIHRVIIVSINDCELRLLIDNNVPYVSNDNSLSNSLRFHVSQVKSIFGYFHSD